MNETDIAKQLLEWHDTDSLVERLADEFGQGHKPPQLAVAARFLERDLVNWTELNGYDEGDLGSAIIRAARRAFDVKQIRAAVRAHIESKWPTIERELARVWSEP